jgi:hypothetical protein
MAWKPSDIKPLGWIIILLIIGSIYWFGIKPHMGALPSMPGIKIPGFGGTGGSTGSGASTGSTSAAGSDIMVLTTKTKQAWMQKEVDAFNAQSTSGKASLDLLESRDSMQYILNGKSKPAVWSPSSPVWIYRLAEVFPQGHIDPNSTSEYKELFKSPLVFLVDKAKLAKLQPILTGPHPFDHIRQINAHGVSIKFGYADPINASSGMLTMSLLLNEYSELHGGIDPVKAAGSTAFASWLGSVDSGLVRSDTSGSTALEQAFENDPTSRDFITAYEGNGLAAIQNNPNIAIVYPSPTANAEQAAVQVNGPWLSDDQKATAQAFLQFISSAQALADGVQFNFRPEGPNGSSTLRDQLPAGVQSQYHVSYTSVELPPYDALNEAAATWHTLTH